MQTLITCTLETGAATERHFQEKRVLASWTPTADLGGDAYMTVRKDELILVNAALEDGWAWAWKLTSDEEQCSGWIPPSCIEGVCVEDR